MYNSNNFYKFLCNIKYINLYNSINHGKKSAQIRIVKNIKYQIKIIYQLLYIFAPQMTFTKFVEVGRVVRINYGSEEGKLAVIVDILNENRVLIDGDHLKRQVIPIRRLQLTKFNLPVGRGARTGSVRKIIHDQKLHHQWNTSSLGKLYAARAKRTQLTDFDRFKVMILRKRLSKLLNVRPKKQAQKKDSKKK